MAKKTKDFTIVTSMADSDTLTGVQTGSLDVQISMLSLKNRFANITDAGNYFSTDTIDAAFQQIGAFMAAAVNAYQPKDADLTAIAALSTTTFGRNLLTHLDAAAALTALGGQPLDADLTAIAALTTTAYGRGLLQLVDVTAARTALGVQAQDTDLQAIADMTTTAFGRAFLGLANAAAALTYIGAAPTLAPTFTGTVTVPTAAVGTAAVNKTQMDTADALKLDKATLTTDGDILTRTGGVAARITRTALANDPAFKAAYLPVGATGFREPVKAVTTTTYAPILADENNMITLSNAAAITVTLPSDATQAFEIGSEMRFVWFGVGKPSFAAGGGATVSATALGLRIRNSVATAKKMAANTWLVYGDLA